MKGCSSRRDWQGAQIPRSSPEEGGGEGAQLELTDALPEGLPSVENINTNIIRQKQFVLILRNIAAWIYSHLRGFYDCHC